jgi:hypothetical protein
VLAKARELCEASYGLMWIREDDAFRRARHCLLTAVANKPSVQLLPSFSGQTVMGKRKT